MTTQITTSTASTATAYSNQRKIDRTSNGVLWAAFVYDGTLSSSPYNRYRLSYSTDDGATWTTPTFSSTTHVEVSAGVNNHVGNISFFIDADDYAHVAYKDTANGYIYYRRGTPNAGRTAWTWSAAVQVANSANYDHPDVVAHREGADWRAHVFMSATVGASVRYTQVAITSAGVASIQGTSSQNYSADYNSTNPSWPSVDLHHTGDGKTVKDNAPHLYVAWSAGATGPGRGIRFKKASYSAGSWTWGTEREIDGTRYVLGNYWLNCLFDGTRVIIGGLLAGDADPDVMLYERDVADTATITRTILSDLINANPADALLSGSLTYDASGNVYFFGADYTGTVTTRKFSGRRWARDTDTVGPVIAFDDSGPNSPYVSAKRGYSGNKIEFIYTDGAASPYSVTYGSISLNSPPEAPSNVVVSRIGAESIDVSWIHNDPDNDPQKEFQVRYRKKMPDE